MINIDENLKFFFMKIKKSIFRENQNRRMENILKGTFQKKGKDI